MKYKGKLYGKIGNKYFDTSNTSCDWDVMVSKIKELEEQLSKKQKVPVAGVSECAELVKPTPEKYGWHTQEGFEDQPSGWVYDGGEDAYNDAMDEWEARQ